MANTINESRLELIAIQLKSIREDYSRKTFVERARIRFNNEFLHGSGRDRVRFVKLAIGKTYRHVGSLGLRGLRKLRKLPSSHIKKIQRRATCAKLPTNRLSVIVLGCGGMGDYIISSAFLNRFFKECNSPIIHVFLADPRRVKEASFVFRDSPAVEMTLTEADLKPESTPYDIVVRVDEFISYQFVREERVRELAPQLLERLAAARQIQQPYRGFMEASPSFDGLFASIASQSGLHRLDVLGWLGNIPFGQDDQLHLSPNVNAYRNLERDFGSTQKRYITIHNGYDNVDHRHTTSMTKVWPEANYVEFIEHFKAKFPDIRVVQLGAKTSRPIENADLCLVNNTSIDEAAWILKHSLLHVDGDTGLVHCARALHTKSLVMFGPTNREFFRYACNENVASTVCGNCWWSTHQWAKACPRGFDQPACMKSIDPAHIADLAEKHLRSLPAWKLTVETSQACEETTPVQQWRRDYIDQAVRAARDGGKRNVKTAILRQAGSLPCRVSELEAEQPTVFTFGTNDKRSGDGSSNGEHHADSGANEKRDWDFGSFHNIPAENEQFDVVVMPLFGDHVAFPYFAIKEALRILKEGGDLVITFKFSSGAASRVGGRTINAADAFFQSLGDLGVQGELVRSDAGGIVLRKQENGRLFA